MKNTLVFLLIQEDVVSIVLRYYNLVKRGPQELLAEDVEIDNHQLSLTALKIIGNQDYFKQLIIKP